MGSLNQVRHITDVEPMPYKDLDAQRKYQREWLAEKRKVSPNSLGWHARKDWINEQKNRPCADCGVRYPYYVMDFDHLGDKVAMIHTLLRTASFDRLKAEIAKCEVVCANCHRIRSFERGQHHTATPGALPG